MGLLRCFLIDTIFCCLLSHSVIGMFQARFEAKQEHHGGPKLKKSKEVQQAKMKALKKAEKSLAWFAGDDEHKEVSKKVARWVHRSIYATLPISDRCSVVICKHMFDPKEFDEDPAALTDIQSCVVQMFESCS